jgi:hypothetical protein
MAVPLCYVPPMNIGVSVVVGAAMIAGAIAVSHRFSLEVHACSANNSNCSRAWRVDQWTGKIVFCQYLPAVPVVESFRPSCEEAVITPPPPLPQ